ncbi:substrate-binding domain-containing protein [Pantoea ananatis]|uniref:substrate-binding domain-containing protein n=1 Tax=Pantoea ananas TaxID=553 RepID=UPI0039B8B262
MQPGDFTYRAGLEAAERLLGLRARPSAIFASNDDMASAVVSVAHRRRLKVPEDLSVVGFDDTSASTMVWLAVTDAAIAAPAGRARTWLLTCRVPFRSGGHHGEKPRRGGAHGRAPSAAGAGCPFRGSPRWTRTRSALARRARGRVCFLLVTFLCTSKEK